jgi:collagenase-like PrtC family protease
VEGRLKNESYVKNVTAYYRQRIDHILEQRPEYQRVISGTTRFFFTPDAQKTFNRTFTPYFLDGHREKMASFDTPKAMGEFVGYLKQSGGKYLFEGSGMRQKAIGSRQQGLGNRQEASGNSQQLIANSQQLIANS